MLKSLSVRNPSETVGLRGLGCRLVNSSRSVKSFAIRDSRIAYNAYMIDSADMYVLLKVASLRGQDHWSQGRLAAEIGVSPSTVNRALKRAAEAKLYDPTRRRLNLHSFEEAVIYGMRFFFAPKRIGEGRGIPTAWAAPPLSAEIASGEALPPVWPDPKGNARGWSVEPLHPSASIVAQRDPEFYALLALVDAIRLGGNRERELAKKELHLRFAPQMESN